MKRRYKKMGKQYICEWVDIKQVAHEIDSEFALNSDDEAIDYFFPQIRYNDMIGLLQSANIFDKSTGKKIYSIG